MIIKTRGESCKFQWKRQCLAKKRNKEALQLSGNRKDTTRLHFTIWCTSLFRGLKRRKFRMRKQQWTRNGRSSKRFHHGKKVHFATSMDISHLKNAELESKHQKYRGRVVLRGDIVKDDSGSHVFTEQGSSASQMTATKVMDVIERPPGCPGQAADAVSAFSQLKLEDAPRLLKIPKSECPDLWICLPRHKWPNIMVKHWRSSGSSRTKFVRTSTCRPHVGKTVRRRSFFGKEKVPNYNNDYSCRKTWMTSRLLEENRIWLPCRRNWWKMWTLTNPHQFLTM